ncbi:hypothetical protein HHK36_010112 [Tetracentron sinense]|uniref:U1 small nuclear ribonucleoprotein 70 kDa n=1 Tax=Tetracentron sinense TaxID=13715 RepID=A0A835DM25_TETSI|nr:hypothetical protein HHK36_010112 [Tetracentron sinense]
MGDFNNDAFMRNRDAAVQARTKAQNRATVLQLKLIGQSHPTGLTSNLLKLFEPRPPLEYKPTPEKRKCPSYSGMAQFVSNFAEPGDPEYAPPVQKGETAVQRRARIHKLRLEKGAEKAAEELEKYDSNNDPNVTGDPYKTLFVARLNYETTEHRIKREFEAYGPIKRVGITDHPHVGPRLLPLDFGKRVNCVAVLCFVSFGSSEHTVSNFKLLKIYCYQNSLSGSEDILVRMITDKEANKPRGYAFVEYMHTRDMKAAYKQADGRKLDNRRVLVDVERGRTVPNWRPRRLGGGLGSTRVGGEEVNQKYSGREPHQSGGRPRSEEPRAREERHIDREREKSRERGRDREKEQEKSLERPHDRTRDRDPREERHHRDRDRNRDRDRERDRGRDRDRTRDRGRGYERDRERDRDRGHDRPRERERDYERGDPDHDHGRSRDREADYDRVEPKHERDRHGEREREIDRVEPEHDDDWYEQPGNGRPEPDHEHGHYDHYQGKGQYGHLEPQGDQDRFDDGPDLDNDRYNHMELDDYQYEHGTSESRERERTRDRGHEYQRSDRSLSREYEH